MRQPHFELTAVGQAAAKGDWGGSSSSEAIMASDVQRLLLYLMMGDKMQDAEIGYVQGWGSAGEPGLGRL